MQMPPVLLDLLLHKPCVLRHLLHNRGSSDPGQRSRERDLTTIKLGLIVLGLDACEWGGPRQSDSEEEERGRELSCFVLRLS